MTRPRSIIEKIWEEHVVHETPGHPAILAIDLHLIHEVTSAQAFSLLRERKLSVFNPHRCVATLDHSIPTRQNRFEIFDDNARAQVEALRQNVREFGIRLYDFGSGHQGIVHVIGPELGLTQPGMTIVCGDSHTSTHGALGALAFGIGTSEVGHVLATGCLLMRKPQSMRVEFRGRMPQGTYAKDVVLRLISAIGVGGANGHIIEYTGEVIERMTMEERLTICNMSIECGARAGLVSPDDTTIRYLENREHVPSFGSEEWRAAVLRWRSFTSDRNCIYDREISLDLSDLEPMVTWGTNPSQAIGVSGRIPWLDDLPEHERLMAKRALEYTGLREGERIEGTPIDWAFIGSCTNGRIEDLRIAAEIMRGRRVHRNVTCFVVPGSEAVCEQAKREGLDRIFEEAGASFRLPGCSMCLGMNDDKVPFGARCMSSSNRNFIGRQGPGSRTHLASPATVAASALAGRITGVGRAFE